MKISKNLLLCSVLTATVSTLQAEEVNLDTLSVTATKVERATQKVSSSIEIISKEEIEDKQMTNLQDALKNTTGVLAENLNQGYDVSIYIRGSGIANKKYGTREIMILKDGMPLTDPLGYTNLQSIDTQDIEQVEITKGPGSIYSTGTTGGVIQILTKSVFDDQDNRVKLSIDEHDNQMANVSVGGAINDNHYIRVNATKKDMDNDWRAYSKYNSNAATIKYGYLTDDDNSLEIDLTYTDIENWLPEEMEGESERDQFLSTAKLTEDMIDKGNTKEIYATSKEVNIKYIHNLNENTIVKPRVFYTTKDQVTHMSGIGHSPNKKNHGIDLELNHNHKLGKLNAELVAGLTYRVSEDEGETYAFDGWTNIYGTNYTSLASLGGTRDGLLSLKGELASRDTMKNSMKGIYLQETIDINDKLTVDASVRYDKQDISLKQTDYLGYNYYGPFKGRFNEETDTTVDTNKSLDVYAFKVGATYAIADTTNIYGLIAQGDQAPHDSQFIHNPDLKPSQSTNYEIGVKERNQNFSYDAAVFYNVVKDEIVDVARLTRIAHDADNAGKTKKKGFEFSGSYNINKNFTVGAAYTYSNYKYAEFNSGVDLSGNYFKLVPKHMYSLTTMYQKDNYRIKIDTKSRGSYYTDDANSAKESGYKFVTDLMASYQFNQKNRLTLSVYNLFNKKYISQAESDNFDPGVPRSAMLTYTYKF